MVRWRGGYQKKGAASSVVEGGIVSCHWCGGRLAASRSWCGGRGKTASCYWCGGGSQPTGVGAVEGGDAFYIYIHMITARGNSSYVQAVCHAKSPHKRVGSSLPGGAHATEAMLL